jgi:hypothetical protein
LPRVAARGQYGVGPCLSFCLLHQSLATCRIKGIKRTSTCLGNEMINCVNTCEYVTYTAKLPALCSLALLCCLVNFLYVSFSVVGMYVHQHPSLTPRSISLTLFSHVLSSTPTDLVLAW